MDKSTHRRLASPSAVDRLEIVPARVALLFDRLPRPVHRILRLCDGERTIDEICELSGLPAVRAHQILGRLRDLGAVTERPPRLPAGARPARALRRWRGESAGASHAASAPEHVRAADGPAASAPEPLRFDDADERFFASSFEHLLED
jgi:hypothetical protein